MRTDEEIVAETNKIARIIYFHMGYTVDDNHKFFEFDRINYHPHEQQCWNAACDIQIEITQTDPEDALSSIED